MKNPRLTKKEMGLLKGAIRRVFSRSELRKRVIASVRVESYTDPTRPRVKKWSMCSGCQKMTPEYLMQCDHIKPLQPLGVFLEEMTTDELVDRAWCVESNLQALCKDCHHVKSKLENAERRRIRKERKNE